MDKAQMSTTEKKYDSLANKMEKLHDHVNRKRAHDVGGNGVKIKCPNGSVVFNWC